MILMVLALAGAVLQRMLGVFFTPEGVIKWTHIGPSTAVVLMMALAVQALH